MRPTPMLLALAAMLAAPLASSPAAAQAGAAYDSAFFAGLRYRDVGPVRGGRSIGVAGSTSRPLEYYFGATGGGLWKTTDGGTTWRPVTDGKIGSASVGAVAVCEADPDVVYIGTGETQLRGNVQPGDGLYKSTDAGKTWEHIGLREARNFSRVRVHPTDCNTVWAGAFGHYGAPNPERGVYKSTDGGETWQKVLYRDERSGAVDISIDPKNPDVVYAALWEAWRKPWGMSSGGPGSGLFKTTDGGRTWTELTRNPGLPPASQIIGKIGVDVSPVDASRVYAIVEADSGGVFRSDDGGATWTRVNDERKLRQRAFYYTRIYADPQEKDIVYVLNTGFYKSTDAGETFPKQIRVPHGDNHDLWIAADDNQRMINANDGGGNVSFNGGETWTEQDFPTAQIYRLGISHHEPYFLCGGQQDNSTVCVPSDDWDFKVASGPYFFAAGGCESGYVANDPKDHDLYFAGCYGGSLSRFDYETGQRAQVNIWPENPMGQSAEDLKQRVQWTYPIVFSPVDPNVLYSTSQYVWKTTDAGQSWEKISPDLTRADPKTMGPSGGPITKDQTGVETFATVFALAPSPHDANILWAGSDDGLVHITRDGGKTWKNITPPQMPELAKITTIDASPHDPAAAYVSANRFLVDDFAPYVYKTTDYGATWTPITNGLPADEIARSIREDIVRRGLLFLGTERGVWISFDDGANWQRLQRNLPVVQVADLAVTDRDLAIATHGRGFWVMDDIGPLRQLSPTIAQAGAHLFEPDPAIRSVDRGAVVSYWLKEPARKVTLEFLDAQGDVIRTFTGQPEEKKEGAEPRGGGEEDDEGGRRGGREPKVEVKPGLHRFAWDMRYPGMTDFPDMIMWAAGTRGPRAVPGTYRVRMTVEPRKGKPVVQTRDLAIRLDPRVTGVAQADLEEQFRLAMRIRDRASQANDAVLLIRGVEQQVEERLEETDDGQVERLAAELRARLDAVEGEIYQVRNESNQDPLNFPIKLNNKIAALLGVVESADGRPTEQSYAVLEDLSAQLDVQLAELERILSSDLPRLNDALRAEGLKPVERRPLQTEEAVAEGG